MYIDYVNIIVYIHSDFLRMTYMHIFLLKAKKEPTLRLYLGYTRVLLQTLI